MAYHCHHEPAFIDKDGYTVVVHGHKLTRLHRLIYEAAYGPIPPGFAIHHRDGDKQNNDPTNLVPIDPTEHNRMHAARQPRECDGRFLPPPKK